MSCKIERTCSSIKIDWSKLEYNGSKIDGFTVKYRMKGTDSFEYKHIRNKKETCVLLDGLTSDTDYDIKLYTSYDGDESLIHKREERTEMSMCGALMLLSIKKDKNGENLDIYQMEPEKIHNLIEHVRYCDMFSGYDQDIHPEKTILLLGATGSGKSTLIDAMFNYIAGVSSMDDYRFKLVHLTEEEKAKLGRQDVSQTNGITCYRIPWKFGSRVNFKLCVIDTPGFGDSRGLEFDKAIPEMVKNLFKKGIQSIDAICLVLPVSCVRLNDAQKYIFTSILEIFAKDISENIVLFITYDDGVIGEPNPLCALRSACIPFKENMYFRFNNANVFKNEHKDVSIGRNNSFEDFFEKLRTTKSISLANTKAVLDTREFLEIKLESILKTIGNQVTDIMNIKEDKSFIADHKEDIENNKNFTKTYHVKLPTMVSHDYDSLNCKQCNETCHERCSVITGMFIWTCEAMTDFKCGICTGNCSTNLHKMEKFTHETKTETRSETIEELKRRYDVAKEGADGRTDMMNQNRARLEKSLEELDSILQQVEEKIKKLKEYALRPNFKCMQDFLDKLISKERTPPVCDTFKERVDILTTIREFVLSGKSLTEMMKDF